MSEQPPCTGPCANTLHCLHAGCLPHLTTRKRRLGAGKNGADVTELIHGRARIWTQLSPPTELIFPRGPETWQNSKHTKTKDNKKTISEVSLTGTKWINPKNLSNSLTTMHLLRLTHKHRGTKPMTPVLGVCWPPPTFRFPLCLVNPSVIQKKRFSFNNLS